MLVISDREIQFSLFTAFGRPAQLKNNPGPKQKPETEPRAGVEFSVLFQETRHCVK